MKAYITCPVTHSKERLNLLPELKSFLEEKGIDSFVFEIGGESEEIFERDFDQLKSCNLIVAEMSEPSHGVGIEVGMSYGLGMKRILLIESGKEITKLAQGMPDSFIIKYSDLKDLKEKLSFVLDKILSQ